MKFDNLPVSIFAAFVIGIVQMFALLYFWGLVMSHSQHFHWLITQGLTGTPLRALLFVLDNALNVALCIPAALALCGLRPRKIAAYLPVAVVPGLLWQYRLVLSDPDIFAANWTMFIPGFLSTSLMLPLAVLIVRRFRSHRNAGSNAVA